MPGWRSVAVVGALLLAGCTGGSDVPPNAAPVGTGAGQAPPPP